MESLPILISAAEVSSDTHAASVLRALRIRAQQDGFQIDAFGVGGSALEKEGLEILVPSRSLLSMGLVEILIRLPKILGALQTILNISRKRQPGVALVLDYPDFHFKLVKAIRKLFIKQNRLEFFSAIYMIPPKVWIWRKGRIQKLKAWFSQILCIFPFEKDFFEKEGLIVHYVGNPLVEGLPLALSKEEARSQLNVRSDEKRVVALLPGSRPAELKNHTRLLLEAALQAFRHQGGGTMTALMPLPKMVDLNLLRKNFLQNIEFPRGFDFRLISGDSGTVLRASDVGLIKSGTSTLEAGILGCPHVVLYKPNRLSCFIFNRIGRMIWNYHGPVGLVNLVHEGLSPTPEQSNARLVKEMICCEVTVDSLANELELLFSAEEKARQLQGFEKLRARFVLSRPAADLAAEKIYLELLRIRKIRKDEKRP